MMAKISDLVKTYRMLSDPNAPDWNVKFAGAVAVAALVVAAAGVAIFWSAGGDEPVQAPETRSTDAADEDACAPSAIPSPSPTSRPGCPAAPTVLP